MATTDYSTFDDEMLWREIKEGNQPAFAAFYSKYFPLLKAEALRKLGNIHEAEDAASEIMQDIGERYHKIEISKSPRAYLFGALQNYLANLERKKRTHKKMIAFEVHKDPEHSFQPGQTIKQYLMEALAKLEKPISRKAFELHLEEVQQKDIASALGISLHAVRKRISRTKQKLLDYLKKDENLFAIIIISYLLQS